MRPKLLSKTKLMRGYRCQKCIYLTIHHPELEPPITPDLQALFDQGNLVGSKAREYYPNGTMIDNPNWDFYGAIAKTQALIAAKTPIIYEAAFSFAGCYARIDILKLNPKSNRYQIIEVKSSTKLKPEHLDDIGLQVWIISKSGLPIESIHLMHLNPNCSYPHLENLFSLVNITQDIRDRFTSIKPKIKNLTQAINDPNIPEIDLGPYCLAPTECSFKAHCWREKQIPAMSIFNMPQLRTQQWEYYQKGIVTLDDLNKAELNELQQRIIKCHLNQTRYINKQGIAQALSQWQFPLIFLDFETINPAIPRYDGCKPFNQTPFQFSVHILETWDSKTKHIEFLHDSKDDPRPNLIPALIDACQTKGSIVAYFGKFEASRIEECAVFSPNYRKSLLSLVERIVDPLPIIREHVYDPAFMGSFSLKKVAPGLLGADQSYDNMEIGNGGDAQRAFEKLISETYSPAKKNALRQAMLDYCKKDTEVMVKLALWMHKAAQSEQPSK